MNEKMRLRQEVLARRDRLPAEARLEMSLAMASHAAAIEASPGAVVSGFLPIRSEPDLRPLMAHLLDRGARLCLPVILDRETIVFRELAGGEELVASGFGTVGPPESAAVLDPQLMLVPVAGFDASGNRLGYGAGHYDRAIARLYAAGSRPLLIGTAFSVQELAFIPAEPHDVPLDMVLTEQGLRTLAGG